MEKNVKINLNGKTISAKDSDKTMTAYAFRVESGCSLTINGEGEVYGGAGCPGNIAVMLMDNSEVVINGGKFTVGRDKDGDCNSTIYVNGNDVKLEINGGEFHAPICHMSYAPNWYYLVNVGNSKTGYQIEIKGGKFYGWDPETGDDKLHGNFVAEGYESYIIDETGHDMEGLECVVYGVRRKNS